VLGKYSLAGLESFAKPSAFNGPYPSRSWSTVQYQTVPSSFPVVKLPHCAGNRIEKVVALFFCSSSTGAAHASVAQKAKNIKSIFVPVPTSYFLW